MIVGATASPLKDPHDPSLEMQPQPRSLPPVDDCVEAKVIESLLDERTMHAHVGEKENAAPSPLPTTIKPEKKPDPQAPDKQSTEARKRQPHSSSRHYCASNSDEYNPNKNCGVLDEHHKPCLRSLACKQHTLTQRNQVVGRSVSFTELLDDYQFDRAQRVKRKQRSSSSAQVILTSA